MKNAFLLLSMFAALFLCGCDSCEVVKVANGKLKFSDGKKTDIPHWNEEGWTHFFFVRHAEKENTGGDAAVLTPAGEARARRLGKIMELADLDLVFATDIYRTQQTANLMREGAITIPAWNQYSRDDIAETQFLQTQLSASRGKRIFVVGHSDSVPRMINKLMGPGTTLTTLDENNFSAFFVVASRGLGDSQYLWKSY